MKAKITTAIGALISIALIVYLIRTTSLREVWQLVTEADRTWIATFLLCSFGMSVSHAWRYLTLLAANGYLVHPVLMYLVVLVRNLGSDLLPARIGTLVYVYLIGRLGVPITTASASFAYALAFDFIAVAPLVLLAALVAFSAGVFEPGVLALIGVVLTFLFAVIVWLLPWLSHYGSKIFHKLSNWKRATEFVGQFDAEVQHISKAGILGRVLALSLMIRIFKYAGLYAFLMALLAPRGYGIADIPPAKALLGMFAAEFSASLPISGIAGIGTYQGAWLAAFSMLGFPERLAATTSVSHHLFTQLYGYSLGIIAFLFLLVWSIYQPKKVTHMNINRIRTLSFALRFICFVFVMASGVALLQAESRNRSKPVMQFPLDETSQRARKDFLTTHEVYFDSNRSGTFGIYKIGKGSFEPVTVVDTPDRHEITPSLSPEGALLAYASARGAGRFAESEIRVLDLRTGESRTLSSEGTFPRFTADGQSVIFERGRRKIFQVNLSNGKEQKLFPTRISKDFGPYEVVKPSISPSGRKVAFTSDRGGRWHAYVADLDSGTLTRVAHGCQPIFLNDEKVLFVKNRGAAGEAGLYSFSLTDSKEEVVLDESTSPAKEYFPSSSGEALLLSRGAGDSHEEDTFNIEARVNGVRIPLTHDSATNRWPIARR